MPRANRQISSAEDASRRVYRRSQATVDVLRYLGAEPCRGRLLDLPCGDGRTTEKLLCDGIAHRELKSGKPPAVR